MNPDSSAASAQQTNPPAAPAAAQPPQNIFSQNSIRIHKALGRYDSLMDLVFRAGFSTVFLANSWTSIVDPAGFIKLLEDNFIASAVGYYNVQLYIIAINDLLLGILILAGVKRNLVYAWAGAWLLVVTFFKVTSLI